MANKLAGAIFIMLVLIFGMICFFTGVYFFGDMYSPEGKSVHFVNANMERTIPMVAVSATGVGMVIDMAVEIGAGEGRALVNINNVLADYDTQRSARDAMAAASEYLMEDLSYTDVIFSIDSYYGMVSGPSAGAPMAAALIATLEDAELNDEVMISGTINSVGEIGAVGGLLEKAKTAKVHGATLFLVPGGQGGRISELVEECEIVGNKEICDSKFVEKDADLSAEAGIEVIEVWTIGEAMGYLLK